MDAGISDRYLPPFGPLLRFVQGGHQVERGCFALGESGHKPSKALFGLQHVLVDQHFQPPKHEIDERVIRVVCTGFQQVPPCGLCVTSLGGKQSLGGSEPGSYMGLLVLACHATNDGVSLGQGAFIGECASKFCTGNSIRRITGREHTESADSLRVFPIKEEACRLLLRSVPATIQGAINRVTWHRASVSS